MATLVLLLLFPLVYLPRVACGAAPEPIDLPPRWADLVVVTTSAWPEGERDEPVFEDLRLTAARVDQVYAPSRSAAGSAASLWTGRFPAHHGVRSNRLGLPPGTWTLAEAARSTGARTAAFLQEPFVGVTGIAGFETVVEDPDLPPDELARRAIDVFGEDDAARVCLWLHVAHTGLPTVVGDLREWLAASPRRFTTFLFVTGFGRALAVHPDGRARVPLYAQLPAGRSAGLQGQGTASLVDPAGALCELLGLPRPEPTQPPLQSRAQTLWANVSGGGGFEWTFLEGQHGDVLRFGKTRVAPDATGELHAEVTDTPAFDAVFEPAPPELAPRLVAQYRTLHASIASGATNAVPVEARPPWSGWLGW